MARRKKKDPHDRTANIAKASGTSYISFEKSASLLAHISPTHTSSSHTSTTSRCAKRRERKINASSNPTPTRRRHLLDLPRELRDEIYGLALRDNDFRVYGPTSHAGGCLANTSTTLKSLRLANRQISSEVLENYFGTQSFRIFLQDCGKKSCDGIKGDTQEDCVCDAALAAITEFELACGFMNGAFFNIWLKKERGIWQVAGEWLVMASTMSAMDESRFCARLGSKLKAHLAGITSGRNGGLTHLNFLGIRNIIERHTHESGMGSFRRMGELKKVS